MPELPLRDIHLPDPISWWHLAIGWWLLLGLVIILIAFVWIMIARRRRPSLKKEALQALDEIEKIFFETGNVSYCLAELSTLLRRAVLSRNPHRKIAGLTGNAWLELLDSHLDAPEFAKGVGQLLLSGPYQESCTDEHQIVQLLQLSRKWVNRL